MPMTMNKRIETTSHDLGTRCQRRTGFVQKEPFHAFASDMIFRLQAQGQRVYTSNYVLSELSALLMSPMRVHGQLSMSIRDFPSVLASIAISRACSTGPRSRNP